MLQMRTREPIGSSTKKQFAAGTTSQDWARLTPDSKSKNTNHQTANSGEGPKLDPAIGPSAMGWISVNLEMNVNLDIFKL